MKLFISSIFIGVVLLLLGFAFNILSPLADVVSIIGLLIAGYQIIKTREDTQRIREDLEHERSRNASAIEVILETVSAPGKTQQKKLPLALRRAEFTRSELMGRLGMMTKNQQVGFNIASTKQPAFLQNIEHIQSGSGDAQLIISCSPDEFNQFIDA